MCPMQCYRWSAGHIVVARLNTQVCRWCTRKTGVVRRYHLGTCKECQMLGYAGKSRLTSACTWKYNLFITGSLLVYLMVPDKLHISGGQITCLHCCYYWNYWWSQQEPSQCQPVQLDGVVWKLLGLDVDLHRTQHIKNFKIVSIYS